MPPEHRPSLDDLLSRIDDPDVRADVRTELTRHGAFQPLGLVFEESAEEIDLVGRRPQRGDRVQFRTDLLNETRYIVTSVNKKIGTATLDRLESDLVTMTGETSTAPIVDLLVTVDHDTVVHPGLRSTGSVGDVSDRPAHVAIKGDNLHILRALTYTHRASIDCILIDPPYNTGNADWLYNDRYSSKDDTYRHSKWLSFMRRRLEIAHVLLKPTGMILVHIDDNEQHRLRMVLDTIFGEGNHVGTFVWRSDGNLDNQAKVKINHEYIHMYARSKDDVQISGVKDPTISAASKLHNDEIRNTVVKNGPKNPKSDLLIPAGFPANFESGVVPARTDKYPSYDGDLVVEGGVLTSPVTANTGWSGRRMLSRFIDSGFQPLIDTKGQETTFELTPTGAIENVKRRRPDQHHILTVLSGLGTTQSAGQDLRGMGLNFPFPKPQPLLKYLASFAPSDAVILDFFGGSGSTLEAVLRMNAEDGGTRQCIVATSNEVGSRAAAALAESGHAPGDAEWEGAGVFDYVLRPRIGAIITGLRPDGSTFDKSVPMIDDKQQRVEFFDLTWLDKARLSLGHDFPHLVPLLWMRAGARGSIPLNDTPFSTPVYLTETFGVVFDPDKAVLLAERITTQQIVYIVTDSGATFQATARQFAGVETRQLYADYLGGIRQ